MFAAFLIATAFAEQPQGVVMRAPVKPVIDGVRDTAYNHANKYNIDKPFVGNGATPQTPATIGAAGETTWEMLWDAEGLYVILTVNDDEWYPAYKAGASNHWEYDKAEIYFDVNYVLADAVGGQSGSKGGTQGHYQMAPAPVLANIDGIPTTEGAGWIWAYKVEDPKWTCEFFVPFSMLTDKEGIQMDLSGVIGFDVTICDKESNDPLPSSDNRKRAVWANIGTLNESYSNMDEVGLITLDGVGDKVYVDKITLTGGTITEDNKPLQMVATVTPSDATVQTMKWSVQNLTGKATIDQKGVLTPIADGVVKVKAEATDGSYVLEEIEVTISGQKTGLWELNLIKNGLFDEAGTAGAVPFWGGWIDGAAYGKPWVVADGVAVLQSDSAHSADNWHYQFNQSGQFTALPNIPYILSFVAWGANDRNICVDFEDTPSNSYNRYGASTDPSAANGRSEWTFPITPVPTKYTFHVTFDQIVETTVQKIQFMISQAKGTVFLDSIMLISEEDLALAQAEGKKVGYYLKKKTMNAEATPDSLDPVYLMLKADPKLEVTLHVVTDVTENSPVDISPYDVVVIQESFGGGDKILTPAGPLALTKLNKPTLYNKTYALKTGRALTAGGSATGAETPSIYTLTVDPANQGNDLFKGITFTDNAFQVLVTGSDDFGALGTSTKALNYATGVELNPAVPLLALPTGVTAAPTVCVNDIPANTSVGGEVIPARMITLGMNFGAICASGGKNITAWGLTLWRNAVYSLAGLTVPNTPVVITGIRPDVANRNIKVYPNPAKDRVYINVDRPTQIGIYSITGSLMMMQKVESAGDPVDVSHLPGGLYIVKGNDFVFKLMKQ